MHTQRHKFFIGQGVLVSNLRKGPRWLPATVVEQCGPLYYLVQVLSGAIWKHHIDHLFQNNDNPLEVTTSLPEE